MIIVLIMLLLCACGSEKQEEVIKEDKLNIVSPSGAPALAFYNCFDQDFETLDASIIKTMVVSEDGPDVAVLPTNVAAALLNKGIDYSLAATITFGNFYIVSTGKDDDGLMDNDDKITLFQQGGIPDLVFQSVYKDIDINMINYVNDASDATREIVNPNSDSEYVLIAEPAMHIALNKNTNASIYADLQDLYKQEYNHELFQASIIVNNKLEYETTKKFLNKVENDINSLLENPNLLVKSISDNKIEISQAEAMFGNVDADVASLDNNGVNLGYKSALENKEGIDTFLEVLGMNKTNEEIYFK